MKYKYKNSKKNILNVEDVKGSIFIFRNKKDMSFARGTILTSEEALLENKNNITHWTPNVYRYGTYIDEKRKITRGHFEKNLRQINTFFLDFDTENITECDILSVSVELGFMPTLIVKTIRGYQAYYVLESPAYINKNTDYKVIEVAKQISNNLRNYFRRENIKVDTLCNHFGIARFPTKENIIYYDKNNIYSFSDWLDWSIKESDRLDIKPNKFYIVSGSKGIKQTDEKWFNLLLNTRNIKGTKGLLGRNNVLFTLALGCYSSGVTQLECEEKLQVFNNNLEKPLTETEYSKIINSAYSGKYTSANKDYILTLCKEWINEDLTVKDLFVYQKWTKFKKKRSERKRIHFTEWEEDILRYISKEKEVYLEIKKKDIIENLNIPKRSLDKVLKALKEKNVILYKSTTGRSGGIKIALMKKVYSYIITLTKKIKERYIKELSDFFTVAKDKINYHIETYYESKYSQERLFELDVGEKQIS